MDSHQKENTQSCDTKTTSGEKSVIQKRKLDEKEQLYERKLCILRKQR